MSNIRFSTKEKFESIKGIYTTGNLSEYSGKIIKATRNYYYILERKGYGDNRYYRQRHCKGLLKNIKECL